MSERGRSEDYLAKAEESLAGAESEFTNRRFNNCANRAYYASFQAAIAALLEAGIRPTSREALWGHGWVQAQFAGQLIGRRKLYPADLRDTLSRLQELRRRAGYEGAHVGGVQADRAVGRAERFVAVVLGGEEQP